MKKFSLEILEKDNFTYVSVVLNLAAKDGKFWEAVAHDPIGNTKSFGSYASFNEALNALSKEFDSHADGLTEQLKDSDKSPHLDFASEILKTSLATDAMKDPKHPLHEIIKKLADLKALADRMKADHDANCPVCKAEKDGKTVVHTCGSVQ